jgi:hypothetical protein
MAQRPLKKIIGVVTSTAMDKTAVVQVDRLYVHSKYRKLLTRRSKFFAHDEHEVRGRRRGVAPAVRARRRAPARSLPPAAPRPARTTASVCVRVAPCRCATWATACRSSG